MTRTTWQYCLILVSSASMSFWPSAYFLTYREKAFFFDLYQFL